MRERASVRARELDGERESMNVCVRKRERAGGWVVRVPTCGRGFVTLFPPLLTLCLSLRNDLSGLGSEEGWRVGLDAWSVTCEIEGL